MTPDKQAGAPEVRCQTCKFFDAERAHTAYDDFVPTSYGDGDFEDYERRSVARNEPFAQCLQPSFFPDLEDQEDVSGVRMIVADGSGYKASLYVHRDHHCAQWQSGA